ncbi:hypothetical protein DFR49_0106 [Hephaestia caeni]|uniref:Secreted protein n=1 Tax=Hephaestia caeni TaxID=645617 RepID=A0A397P7R2_9SPHN|nr:hypothetical protein [Hephaestia caeni]RIA45586.1 hypothetical protein DFR49_0106 [Hephaestia caeni]
MIHNIRMRTLLGGCALLALAGCGADDVASPGEGVIVVPTPSPSPTPSPTPTPTPTPGGPAADCPTGFTNAGVIANLRNCSITGRINSDLNIPKRAGTVYSLVGRVDVGTDVGGDGTAAGGKGVTLSIDPGVVVFGSGGLDFLIVNRGSKINAVGTPTQPIIFTGRRNVEGTATDDSQALWGGVVLLGRAPISDCIGGATGGAADCQSQFEGTADALFGGATATDSSGALQYVQIRYAGFELAKDKELNGLTLAGVGSGTTLDHIQVHNSSDDGIEMFGGRANLKYVALTGNDDDNLDSDQGYQGFVQFAIVAQRANGQSGDSILEVDSNGNEDSLPRTFVRLANFTFLHRSTLAASVNAMLFRGGTDYTAVNGIVVSPRVCLDIDETGGTTTRAADAALQDQGPPVFKSVVMQCGEGAYQDDGNVTVAKIKSIFEVAGANNKPDFTNSLTGFINGANEAAVPAFNAATLGSFFTTTDYIGAVKNASDTWYQGWTCDSSTLDFGSGASCTAIPTE